MQAKILFIRSLSSITERSRSGEVQNKKIVALARIKRSFWRRQRA